MGSRIQIKLANISVDNITLKEALEALKGFIASKQPHLIVTPNPEIIVAAQDDKELFDIMNSANLCLPDGISMVVVSKILGKPLKERVTGIDFLLASCELAAKNGWRVFLLGGAPGIAEKVALNLISRYPDLLICGTHDGYFKDDNEIVARIKAAKPDILFAGLGAVRQEKWLKRNLNELGVSAAVGVGGSFDVIAGIKKRAPKWIQSLYLEWLYRLITEPGRWKRQLALPKFLWLTLISSRRNRSI